ncbi:DUF6544 family protein [Actinosynnema sp. NPDC047251]|uniref:Uncharacterized protein n=1 Tax=Saccharothrix espanaensis (strain ATCC 51144 / DSM 44229 / JCM 9112 / NBRC 15066 / NRRL 15764) TaxID=1179773 RepID=K0K5M6_SACES|nr:DUF6544 family protein [Saccharothrix espanaensis]CCH32902.1 hypothetical protein BN6_56430 [Saccharothrix espanaensis DSM 44229]
MPHNDFATTVAHVTPDDLAHLPEPARRHLTFAGVVGRTPDRSVEARLRGWFRMRPDQRWTACDCHQYNTAPEVTRRFRMRTSLAHLFPLRATDTYLEGHGRLHATALGLFTVADEHGPELDAGELVTYLADAVLLAPSMLLPLPVGWTAVDEHTYQLALTDHGHTVTGRVTVDHRGAPRDFTTDDRWAVLPEGLVRTRWSTPLDGWLLVSGRMRPRRGTAVWHLPDGPFAYAQLDFTRSTITYNATAPAPASLS